MAGLAGILSLRDTVDRASAVTLVEKMGSVQAHRGASDWRVVSHPGLVHVASRDSTPTALSETDAPAERPSGPFLAFDGEITSHGEVSTQLGRAGASIRSESVRELVLLAWEHWGEQCLDHLDGRFAFVVHHPAQGASFLVRDRFGHRPFHYTISDGRLYFASEIKTLLAVTAPPALNELALLEWSIYGDLLPPRTLLRGIWSLGPGHFLRVDRDGRTQQYSRYYDPANVVDPARYAEHAARSTSEILEILEAAIDQAVKSHINGRHDDVGVMLSGGVDSAVIAARASRHMPIRGYHFWVTGDRQLDESPAANEVARTLGLPLQTIVMNGETYRRELARATYHYEMPLWHMQGVPVQLLARRAREDGTSLLLSGDSVGPLLGVATDRHRWILPSPFLSRVPDDAFRIVRKSVCAAVGLAVGNPFFDLNFGVGLQLVDGGARMRRINRCNAAYEFLADLRERRVHVMRLSDNSLFLPRFFDQGDRLCMGASVEYCDACVEMRFVSLALNLPTDVIFHNKISKWILKELATRYVSRNIAFRKKSTLDVPLGEYFEPLFKQSLFEGGFLESYLGLDWSTALDLVKRARERRAILFQLTHIEVWGRLFLLQQSVSDVDDLLSCKS